jgi:hypothetical protein
MQEVNEGRRTDEEKKNRIRKISRRRPFTDGFSERKRLFLLVEENWGETGAMAASDHALGNLQLFPRLKKERKLLFNSCFYLVRLPSSMNHITTYRSLAF